jgi:hypothetical protein
MNATWKPVEEDDDVTERRALPNSVFALPPERKDLTDATHGLNAIGRFDQVIEVSDGERELAFANSRTAAEYHGVALDGDGAARVGRSAKNWANCRGPQRVSARGARVRPCRQTRT